ncbi:hypothetical protein LCGC14_1058150 [marine sediment metagenome]|uniref:Uncharacterized protein n=1 Tax=marine sediment metagenome TaxID=412755 RepID=A0A0F9QSW8_9ZZZZ
MNEDKMKAIFLLAGLDIESHYELANEYWPDCAEYADVRRASPWWLVKTQYGLIKIGWRKRVINIDWSDTEYRSGVSKFADGSDIDVLTKDDVTKAESMVHAYGYAKAVQYLSALDLRLQQVAYAAENPVENPVG